MFIHF